MSSTTEPEKDRMPAIGDVVKTQRQSYRIIGIIGEGGYGTVFEGTDNERWTFSQIVFV